MYYLVKVIIVFTKEKLIKLINDADAVVIGAGAGLSSAAGFEYGGKTFMDNFKYMYDEYGYQDMYSAGFHDFDREEEKWAYWSKMIYLNRYKFGAKDLYKRLLKLVENKDYFVITTNVDHQFQLAGFDKTRLFYMQGDYGLFQCSKPCSKETYDNKEYVLKMVEEKSNVKVMHHTTTFYKDLSTMQMGLESGSVDEISTYQCVAKYLIAHNPKLEPVENHGMSLSDSFCFAMRKDEVALKKNIDNAITEMKKRGCKNIKLMVLVAAPEGIDVITSRHPDVDIYAGALDDHLNEHGYIVPGLGDAGDRIFGTK